MNNLSYIILEVLQKNKSKNNIFDIKNRKSNKLNFIINYINKTLFNNKKMIKYSKKSDSRKYINFGSYQSIMVHENLTYFKNEIRKIPR